MIKVILASAVALLTVSSVEASTVVSVPAGDMQIYYRVISKTDPVAETYKTTRDLSSPISASSSSQAATFNSTANAMGRPTVAVSGSTEGSQNLTGANVGSALTYFIYVGGPDTAILVPIVYKALLATSASGRDSTGNEGSQALATFGVQEYANNPDAINNDFVGNILSRSLEAQNRYGSDAESFSTELVGTLQVQSSHYLAIDLGANVRLQDGGYGSAMADPYFQIDQEFVNAHPGYSLSFSPFAGNVAPVPEPATWAIMLTGFGLIGLVMRRRSAAVSLA